MGRCAIHGAWTRARAQLLTELAATSLKDVEGQTPLPFPTK
jgi:DNA-binding IscR family transcriptional regulator